MNYYTMHYYFFLFFFFKTIYIPGQYIVQDRSRDQRKRNYGKGDACKQNKVEKKQDPHRGAKRGENGKCEAWGTRKMSPV